MEDFFYHFDSMSNFILDALNVVDNEQNRQTLKMNGEKGVDIGKERAELFDLLKQVDVHRGDATYLQQHATFMGHNRTEEALTLLGMGRTRNINICKKLKEMTIALDYEWKFSNMC